MSDTLVDSYSESNRSTDRWLAAQPKTAQSFTAIAGKLTSCKFYMKRSGTVTGTAVAVLYAHQGTFGSTGIPSGGALATSGAYSIADLTTSYQLIEFFFTGAERYTLVNGTHYFISLEVSGADVVDVLAGADNTSPSHAGRLACYVSDWFVPPDHDMCFYVYALTTQEESGSFELSGSGTVSATGSKGGISSISLSGGGILATIGSKGALSSTKWSGLAMGMFTPWGEGDMDIELDILKANGFEYLRIDIPNWDDGGDPGWLAASKQGVLDAVAKGFKVIWGVSTAYTILTTSNWDSYETGVLAAAQWAQDNGVYEFQLGNELENYVDEDTILTSDVPALVRDLATQCQAIFTNGNISYSAGRVHIINEWAEESRGDIDLMAINIYKIAIGSTLWSEAIDELIDHFGLDHSYITEFNLNATSIATYSADTDVQAQATKEMIDYFKASGISRAHYFYWKADAMGVRNANGSYKEKIWNILLTSDTPFLSDSGSLVFTGIVSISKVGSFLLSGNGNLSAIGIKGALGIPALSGNGILTFTGSKQGFGSFLLSDTGSQEFLGSKGGIGVFILSDSGDLIFTGNKGAITSFILSGGGNLLFTGYRERFGAFILSGGGNQTFTGYKVEVRKILRLGYHRSLRL